MLGAIRDWTESVAVRLLEGERLLLRLPPRLGKTDLAHQLAAALGDSAVLIDGAAFTEKTQGAMRIALGRRIDDAVSKSGSAQLIFDSYHVALSRSQGARLQTWLVSKLIDSSIGRDVGALFTARCGSVVHRSGSGSPLVSRVVPITPPKLKSEADLPTEARDAWNWFGDSALLARRSLIQGHFNPIALADILELDSSYIADVRSVAQTQIDSASLEPATAGHQARCATQGLLTPDGPTRLYWRLRPLLTASIDEESPGWPPTRAASVKRFVNLVGSADQVIWVDRYMYRDVQPLRTFLSDVLQRTGHCRIDLLGSRNVNDREVSRAEMIYLNSLPQVEARWMTQNDYRSLHDRHLVTGPGGWVMPQVHVVVGRQDPGSAIVAAAPRFGVDYRAIWQRSHVVL